MPDALPTLCAHPGCGVRTRERYCQRHADGAVKRPHAAARGYGHRWRTRIRPRQLRRHPLCQDCQDRDLPVPATIADHVIPRQLLAGDAGGLLDRVRDVLGEELYGILRRNPDHSVNLRSVCAGCHSAKTFRERNAEFVVGCARWVRKRWESPEYQ